MTSSILLFGLIITFFNIVRPILYKPCAEYFPAEMSSTFTGSWLVLSIFITLPFWGNLLQPIFDANNWYAVLLSCIKGLLLWFLIKLQQIINKESTSTSVFYTFIAFAIGALLNNLFFGENLPLPHLLAIIGFGVLGLIYFLKGDIRRLSMKSKTIFFILVAVVAFFMVTDHIVINRIGWYPHIAISSIIMFIVALINGISKSDYKNIFLNPKVATAGLIYVIGEYFIIYSAITIMPVSYMNLFSRLAAPVVMIFSAIKYKEQTVKNQAVFGLLALALASVIIFIN